LVAETPQFVQRRELSGGQNITETHTPEEASMADDMTDSDTENPKVTAPGNAAKPVEDWVTGDEPMTGAQASYLKTLSEEAGEPFDGTLTKAEASLRIDALQESTGRGR
jgi:hypothetical protein